MHLISLEGCTAPQHPLASAKVVFGVRAYRSCVRGTEDYRTTTTGLLPEYL